MTDKPTTLRYHHQFQSILPKQKIDLSNIPNHLKSLIINQSADKLREFKPFRVTTRSEQNYAYMDTKQLLELKKSRMQAVYNTGFLSDPKELYRPLGSPQLDINSLLYETLDLDVACLDTEKAEVAQEEAKQQKNQAKNKMKGLMMRQNSNGFRLIKDKLQKSNYRTCSFGVPFEQVCTPDTRARTFEDAEEKPVESKSIDWNHLEIDQDRKTFFQNMHNKNNVVHKPPPAEQKEAKRLVKQKYSIKALESALGIKKDRVDTTESFFKAREEAHDSRSRLNFRLGVELDRIDSVRLSTFQRKVNFFQISKVISGNKNGNCLEDLTYMRKRFSDERKEIRSQLLRSHPWYNELINKVVVLNGVQRKVTAPETLILEYLKRIIEDKIRFGKDTFLELMKQLDYKDFIKDEVQRIIRFVKAHVTISERDYLEVVEMAGHSMIF